MRDKFLAFGTPLIGDEEVAEVLDTLASGWLGTGPKTRLFEERFAAYVGARHAVGLSSCTAALHLALEVIGVAPGDEVITSPLTFPATANVVEHCGARPVFVDVDRRTMNIDPHAVEAAITPRTRAIVPVHLAGRPCDMARLLERNLVVRERHWAGMWTTSSTRCSTSSGVSAVRARRPDEPTTAEASGATRS